jgi:Ion channel
VPSGPDVPTARAQAGFRYGGVLAATFALLLFVVLAPDRDWASGVAVALQGAALVVIAATSRVRDGTRRSLAVFVAAVIAVLAVAIAAGLLSEAVTTLVSAVLAALVPVALARGLFRLIRERGVTLQAVAAGLAIYLSLGLLFTSLIGFVAAVHADPYFAQGGDVTNAERAYFSFTVLTTTGFGDLTPGIPIGRALAVVEMLVGQLYLVTVIGLLVGRVVRAGGVEQTASDGSRTYVP